MSLTLSRMTGSRFLRIALVPPSTKSPEEWFVEVDHEGYIVREIEFDTEGQPVKITRPGEYGMWNDSDLGPRVPPDSEASRNLWDSVGATDVSGDTFEARWAIADAALPPRRRDLLGFLKRRR